MYVLTLKASYVLPLLIYAEHDDDETRVLVGSASKLQHGKHQTTVCLHDTVFDELQLTNRKPVAK